MRAMPTALWAALVLLGLQQVPSSALSPDSSFVDHSSQNLSSVPGDLPRGVTILDLSINLIEQLHRGDFENTTHLLRLNVSWNRLEAIHAETFKNTPLLERLDLSHNRLRNLSGQTYLLHTPNLLMLNLTWNSFVTMTLGSAFASLVKLKSLALAAPNIGVGDFKGIAKLKLQTLTLCLASRQHYKAGSLRDVRTRRLQIASTSRSLLDLDLYADALSLFEEVELMNLTGGYLELAEVLQLKAKISTSRHYLTNISITWFDLTRYVNVILQSSITHMSATDVDMYNLPLIDSFVYPRSRVKSFSLRNAVVKSFIFSQESVYNFFINLPVENAAIMETALIHMTCPKSQSPLALLDFSNCALSETIFSRVEDEQTRECQTLSNLKKLVLIGNNLKSLQLLSQRVQHMNSLQHLDLSLNSLFYEGLDECVWPSNITHMNLSSNRLTEFVFKCLPQQTETLDLQSNQVSMVPSAILNLQNLTTLNLTSNRLRDLPVCDGFPNLNTLLLRSNSILTPSVDKLGSCPQLKSLDVSVNPFTCTCGLRSFIHLGITAKKNGRDAGTLLTGWPSEYYCTYPEYVRNTILTDVSIPLINCNVVILAATILCPAIIVVLTVVTLCYRFDVPWYLKMIWKWTRAKHRTRARQVRPEDLVGVEFHAFVSYSQHDTDWVHNSLVPNLEGPAGGLRLCLHEKHFVPGKTIVDNILGCVEKSRRSLFVLSTHFVKSDWCHYELYFASHQRLARGTDSIVLVLLEPLPQYTIPSKYFQLKNMMKRHTYLEWPQDRAKHRLFWANLRAALQADLPNAAVTEIQD